MFLTLVDLLDINAGALLVNNGDELAGAYSKGFDETTKGNLILPSMVLDHGTCQDSILDQTTTRQVLQNVLSSRNAWLAGQSVIVTSKIKGQTVLALLLADSILDKLDETERARISALLNLILRKWYLPLPQVASTQLDCAPGGMTLCLDLAAPVLLDLQKQYCCTPKFLEIAISTRLVQLLAEVCLSHGFVRSILQIAVSCSREDAEQLYAPLLERNLSDYLGIEPGMLPVKCL